MFEVCSYRFGALAVKEPPAPPAGSQAPIIGGGGIMVVMPMMISSSSRQRRRSNVRLQTRRSCKRLYPAEADVEQLLCHFPAFGAVFQIFGQRQTANGLGKPP